MTETRQRRSRFSSNGGGRLTGRVHVLLLRDFGACITSSVPVHWWNTYQSSRPTLRFEIRNGLLFVLCRSSLLELDDD